MSSGKHRSLPFRVTLKYQTQSSSWHQTSQVLITPRAKRYAKDSDAYVVDMLFTRRGSRGEPGRQLITYQNHHV